MNKTTFLTFRSPDSLVVRALCALLMRFETKETLLPVDFVCQDVFLGRDLNLRWSDYTAVPFLFSTYLTPLMSSQSFSQPSEDEES